VQAHATTHEIVVQHQSYKAGYHALAVTEGILDNFDVTEHHLRRTQTMSAKPGKKKKQKQAEEAEESVGLWVDATLIARLHGRHSPTLATPTPSAESERLLHYADVVLGTEKKDKFVASRPQKNRTKL
jgi:hypothetical protein